MGAFYQVMNNMRLWFGGYWILFFLEGYGKVGITLFVE